MKKMRFRHEGEEMRRYRNSMKRIERIVGEERVDFARVGYLESLLQRMEATLEKARREYESLTGEDASCWPTLSRKELDAIYEEEKLPTAYEANIETFNLN